MTSNKGKLNHVVHYDVNVILNLSIAISSL